MLKNEFCTKFNIRHAWIWGGGGGWGVVFEFKLNEIKQLNY